MKKLSTEELNRLSIRQYHKAEKIPVVLILDNIRSMHNVGSVFRTADAFLIEEIILCGITPTPPHRDIQKTALGATESVLWKYEKDTASAIKKLKAIHYTIVGLEQTTHSVLISNYKVSTNKKYAICLGNEVEGISDEAISLLDEVIEIPQSGTKHSLNVSVAAGIISYYFYSALK